jgi:hypothetical protein
MIIQKARQVMSNDMIANDTSMWSSGTSTDVYQM